MLRYLTLVLKNTLRNRRRTTLTVLSIAASLCLLGSLAAMYRAFFLAEATEEESLRLIVRNRVSITSVVPIWYGDRIRQIPGVRAVSVLMWFGGSYKDPKEWKNNFARYSVDHKELFTIFPEYRISEEEKQAFLRERTACVIGRDIADRLGLRSGDRVVLEGDLFPVRLELTVRGIYDCRRDNENLFFHHEYLRESLPDFPKGYKNIAAMFIIRAHDTESVPRIAAVVDESFRNSPFQTKTETERAFELSFLSYLGNVKVFLLSLAAALTFTVILVSANTMAMTVRERAREVGVLRTLGFTRGMVLAVILAEAVLIALAGGALGISLAALSCNLLRRIPVMFVSLQGLYVTPAVGVACLAVAAAIGVVSASAPAWSAARRAIVQSLRFTD